MSNMSKRMKYITGTVVSLIVIFIISFYVSGLFITKEEVPNNDQKVAAGEPSNLAPLDQKVKVSLFKGDKKEKEQTLAEVSKDLGLEGDVSKDELSDALKEKGYTLEGETSTLLTFKRTAEGSVEPNKFYIKTKDDYLAIYKSNDAGELKIEDESKDVYKDCRKYSELPEGDKHLIDNLELMYNTKEEAEDQMYEYTS